MSDLSVPGVGGAAGQSVLKEAAPGTVMDGPRLVVCYECATITKLAPYVGPPAGDRELERCVEMHQHLNLGPHDVHMHLMPTTQETWDHLDPVQDLRKEALANGIWIEEYRSQVSEDAVKCHQAHGQPSLPGKPCIDYKDDSKRLGGGLPVKVSLRLRDPAKLQYLCTYCPYESTVTTQKRWDQGAYKL